VIEYIDQVAATGENILGGWLRRLAGVVSLEEKTRARKISRDSPFKNVSSQLVRHELLPIIACQLPFNLKSGRVKYSDSQIIFRQVYSCYMYYIRMVQGGKQLTLEHILHKTLYSTAFFLRER
jgi:hypothetical protein